MTNPMQHMALHHARLADLTRDARRHPLADMHQLERRSPLGRLTRRFRQRDAAYAREFKIA